MAAKIQIFSPSLFTNTKAQTSKSKPHFQSLTIVSASKPSNPSIAGRKLRAAVIGGGPAGSSAAEALAAGGVETFLSKPSNPSTPLCMLDEFDIPLNLVDRHVTSMRIFSPSNISVDFGKTLKSHEFIAMLRREVLDSFLLSSAVSAGASLISGLVTAVDLPASPTAPYTVRYTADNNSSRRTLHVDVVIGADGANSRVAKPAPSRSKRGSNCWTRK